MKKNLKILLMTVIVLLFTITFSACNANFFMPKSEIEQDFSKNASVNINYNEYKPSSNITKYKYTAEPIKFSSETDLAKESNSIDTVDIGDNVNPSVVKITIEDNDGNYNSQGSGVVYAQGIRTNVNTAKQEDVLFIMTCAHVITDPQNIIVRFESDINIKYLATLVGASEADDIAIISIAKPLTPNTYKIAELRKLDKDIESGKGYVETPQFKKGEVIVVIGTPIGLDFSVTKGIISGIREISLEATQKKVLQIDASVNPGNSGGPLFDGLGRLSGIVVAKSIGNNIDLIGYAIRISSAYDVAIQILENAGKDYVFGYLNGTLEKVTLGITVAYANGEVYITAVSKYGSVGWFNAQGTRTPIVGIVKPQKPNGERILKIDNKLVTHSSIIADVLRTKKIGDYIDLTIKGVQTPLRICLIPNVFGNTPRFIA